MGLFGDIGGGDLVGLVFFKLIFVFFLWAESDSIFEVGVLLSYRFVGTEISSVFFFFVIVAFAFPDSEVRLSEVSLSERLMVFVFLSTTIGCCC